MIVVAGMGRVAITNNFLEIRPWASHCTSLISNFLNCKMETVKTN